MKHFLAAFLHNIGLSVTSTVAGFFMSFGIAIVAYCAGIYNSNINMFNTVLIVLTFDWLVGMYKGWKIDPGGFQIWKAMKFPFYVGAYSSILFVTLAMEASHPAAFWLSEAVYLPILLFQFLSALKNMALVGLIPNGLLLKLLESIDKHKNSFISDVRNSEADQVPEDSKEDRVI